MNKKLLVVFMSLLVSSVFVTASFSAPKPKPCNALKKDRCGQREDCQWMDEHKRKDGKKIKAHCKCKGDCKK